jgi:hypothetical protein
MGKIAGGGEVFLLKKKKRRKTMPLAWTKVNAVMDWGECLYCLCMESVYMLLRTFILSILCVIVSSVERRYQNPPGSKRKDVKKEARDL